MRSRSTTGSHGARMALAVAVSIAVNSAVIAALSPLVRDDGGSLASDEPRVVTLVPIEEVADERADRPRPDGQFVSLPEPDEEVRPEEARFLDRFDRAVERETVAPDDLVAVAAATAPPPPPAPRPAEERARREERVAINRRPDAVAEPAPGDLRPSEADESSPLDELEDAEGGLDRGTPEPADPGAEQPAQPLDLSFFNPTLDSALAFAVPGGSRTDHLDLDEGDRTLLNSHRSIYWGFFNRMKEQVRLEWDPARIYRRHDPTGQLYGARDRYTVLTLTLNSDGSLRNALVSRSSELDFLDREALRAIEAAAPFQNVPEGLKDEDGLMTTNFGFMFSIDSRRSRIHRL